MQLPDTACAPTAVVPSTILTNIGSRALTREMLDLPGYM